MIRVRPAKKEPILNFMRLYEESERISRTQITEQLQISYYSSRYWMEKLAEEGLVTKEVVERGKVRRVYYHRVLPKEYLYRTQLALMFYTKQPRTKTPDPIAEFRCTVVSPIKGVYSEEEFEKNCIYVGVIMAPQTWWIKQEYKIVASELDEPIDKDEVKYSVPVFGKLNYCERYAIFFKSRQGDEMYRHSRLEWWLEEKLVIPVPRTGDYEYNEVVIKRTEESMINAGELKSRFNNILGVMERISE